MTIIRLPNGIYERYEYTSPIFNPTNYKIYELSLSQKRNNKLFNVEASQIMLLDSTGSFSINFNEKGILKSSDDIKGKILPISFDSLYFSNSAQVGKSVRFLIWK